MITVLYSPAEIEESYRRCRSLTRKAARNFYFAFIPLPRIQRRSIYAIYTFCRRCDDIADSPAPPDEKERALRDQEARIDRLYAGEAVPDGGVEIPALADTIRRYRIPYTYFADFLTAIRADVTFHRYPSFDDLRAYCYGVASAVGLMTLEILGYDRGRAEEARAAAVELGLAMQLTNILRDIKEDVDRGRIYLPEAEWREYDLTPADFRAGVVDERFRAFMAFQVRRARHHFNQARRLLGYVPRRARACPATLQALYSLILDRIEGTGYDVYRHAPKLSGAEKISLTLLALGKSWLLPAPVGR